MAELRWVLLAAGLVVLAAVFWLGRRESRGQDTALPGFFRRVMPRLSRVRDGEEAPDHADKTSSLAEDSAVSTPQRIVTVRLIARGQGTFEGEDLLLALRGAGLRHGRFGIFHRHDKQEDDRILFSVASLVEPGRFDLSNAKTQRFPGVSLFMVLPNPGDCLVAFDDMLSTARALSDNLEGELLDEQGSHLSVQRERYLREEVIQFQHQSAAI